MIKEFLKKNYFLVILGLVLAAGLYFLSLYSYVFYHIFIELFSIIIAAGIFVIAWNAKKYLDNNFLLFVGIAYLFVALLDLLHMLAYQGMGVFSGFIESNLATQLWIAARYVQSISLMLALLFITRRLNPKLQFGGYLAATILIMASIFYWKIFPVCFIEGTGLTTFKVISEYLISFILAVTIFFLYFYRKEFNKTVYGLIIFSLAINIFSELAFTLYTDVYGLFNQLGHFLKFLSFFLIYKAVIETGFSQPLDILFFKLKQSEKEIKASEKKFRSLYLLMNEAACLLEMIYDKSGKPVDYRILEVNRAYQSITGFDNNQVIGKKITEIFKIESAPYLDIYARVVNTGKPVKIESFFKPMGMHLLISAFSPSRGKVAAVFSDITDRKEAEKEIENLSRFPQENPNPVMRINENNLITYANYPAKNILKQLGNDEQAKFMNLLHISTKEGSKNIDSPKTVDVTIGKLIYEFMIVPVKEYNYLNIYGKDITSRKKAEKLEKKIAKEKALSKERNKLARELHDTVTQTLFSANLIAGTIPKLWKKDPDAVAKRLEEIKLLHDIALKEMRILLYELKPSTLKDENLPNLLQRLVKSMEARSKAPVKLSVSGKHKFSSKTEFGFYRIAQEALNNIIKHSSATKADIALESSPGQLSMSISDNGRGFDDKRSTSANLGLNIMKERAKIIGAAIKIDSQPGKGTRVEVVYKKLGKKE